MQGLYINLLYKAKQDSQIKNKKIGTLGLRQYVTTHSNAPVNAHWKRVPLVLIHCCQSSQAQRPKSPFIRLREGKAQEVCV